MRVAVMGVRVVRVRVSKGFVAVPVRVTMLLAGIVYVKLLPSPVAGIACCWATSSVAVVTHGVITGA